MKTSALLETNAFPTPLPSAPRADEIRVVVQSQIDEAADRAALRAGLLAHPARSSPKFFYDPQGAALFGAICELDEYYPTRTEAGIFERERAAIAARLPRGSQWIDLGCGDAMKSRGWLTPARVRRYLGVDIAEPWLRSALAALAGERAAHGDGALEVQGIVTDFTRPFDLHDVLAEAPALPPVFFYPGSSIGNFTRDEARAFLASVRDHIERHASGRGKLLIGVDLVKDRDALRDAYDDAIGVTAAFNRNVLRVANRLLDADFDARAFAHRSVFDETHGRIEMQLVSTREQTVRIGDDRRTFAEGEAIVTEYSTKYSIESFGALLESAGYATGARLGTWRDPRGWFGVFVAEPA